MNDIDIWENSSLKSQSWMFDVVIVGWWWMNVNHVDKKYGGKKQCMWPPYAAEKKHQPMTQAETLKKQTGIFATVTAGFWVPSKGNIELQK